MADSGRCSVRWGLWTRERGKEGGVSVVMAGGAPHPFIGSRGGRGSGWVEGALPVSLMVVGGRFRRGTGSHGWGLKGGGGETVSEVMVI
jgi:hypothetical protein